MIPRETEALLYPALEPYATGRLDVGEGQRIYWEECGNPAGKPALVLHGGPGGGCSPAMRRYFDPERYRVVLFDQRQCGRSTPHASEPGADLTPNTTWNLVADIEKLRLARGIDRWLIFGGSLGSALALAYAETCPDRVTELVLRGIFTLRRSELDWFYNGGAGQFAPVWREVFLAPLGGAGFSGDAILAYHTLLSDPDTAIHIPAAVAWSTWESAVSTLEFSQAGVDESAEPRFATAFARIENHFFVHDSWLAPGQLIADAGRIRGIPGVIVQGQYDLCCPPVTAHDLHRAWPEADFRLVLAGHSSAEPAIARQLVAATDGFARG